MNRANVALVSLCIALAITLAIVSIWAFHGEPNYQTAQAATGASQHHENYFSAFWRWTTHDPVAFYTSLLAIFTAVLAVSTIGLWIVTYLTLRHAREDAARQARETRESIDAAVRTADAGALAVGSDRAWMMFDDVWIVPSTDVTVDEVHYPRAFVVQIKWKNVGRSPAVRANSAIDIKLIPLADQSAPRFQIDNVDAGASIPIGPNSPIFSPPRVIGGQGMDDLITRRVALILYGVELYRDIFNSSIERRTEVCLRIEHSGTRTTHQGVTEINWSTSAIGTQNTAT